MIVIEGPDASGKSTLASFLGEAMHCPIQRSEGPPKHPGEMNERLERYSFLPANTIFDRHPCVSEDIYAHTLGRPFDIAPMWQNRFYHTTPLIIIYCDPMNEKPDGRHEVKHHDKPEHLEQIAKQWEQLTAAYREWALCHANMIYRIGDDMDSVLHFVTDYTRDIGDFHRRFGLEYDGPPRVLPQELRQFRISFMAEELCEYAGVDDTTKKLIQSALVSSSNHIIPLEDQFDALIDLQYVLLGTSHLHGFPFKEGWARVHGANMTKVRAQKAEDSNRLSTFDVVKPPGFVPPDLTDLVRTPDLARADEGTSPC